MATKQKRPLPSDLIAEVQGAMNDPDLDVETAQELHEKVLRALDPPKALDEPKPIHCSKHPGRKAVLSWSEKCDDRHDVDPPISGAHTHPVYGCAECAVDAPEPEGEKWVAPPAHWSPPA